ncbi:MAG: alpha/beta hydrolase [Treponema sp.]|nr:alpha/beta hydrolase [Treponema sp.]
MKGEISFDDVKINYEVLGKGMPVLFIHGWSVDHLLWKNPVEKSLGSYKKKYKRIYFDLPGMGKSTCGMNIHNTDDMLELVCKFITYIIGGEDFILAGESYGGYIAQGLLVKMSGRIRGLFLLCPLIFPGYRKGRHAEHIVLERDDTFMNTLSPEKRKEFEYLSVVQTKDTYTMYKKDINLQIMKENEGFLSSKLDGSFTYDLHSIKVTYDRPVLVLVGRQDTEVGFEDQYDLYKDYKRASVCILDKSGHNLQIEQNKIFGVLFLEWLDRIRTMDC